MTKQDERKLLALAKRNAAEKIRTEAQWNARTALSKTPAGRKELAKLYDRSGRSRA